MDVQFIIKDKYRRAVLEDLSNGEQGADRIAKRNHLPSIGVDRAVRELRAEELVGGPEEDLYLTEQGKALLTELRGMERGGTTGAVGGGTRAHQELGPKESRKRTENQGT